MAIKVRKTQPKTPAAEKAPKSRIVAATGIAVKSTAENKARSKAMEAAMSQAVLDAGKEGITDPAKVKERMMAAQRKVRDEFDATAAEAARKAAE